MWAEECRAITAELKEGPFLPLQAPLSAFGFIPSSPFSQSGPSDLIKHLDPA